MSDQLSLFSNVASLNVSPELAGYTMVRINCGQNEQGEQIIYESGDETGMVLEFRNPFGTQQMADNILSSIQGFQYQPYSATSALLNPASEMGDGVTIHGIYSGIYTRQMNYGALTLSDISAPQDEEIEHEFAVESTSEREYTRFTSQVRAMLKVQADAITAEVTARINGDNTLSSALAVQATQISAKVSKTGGSSSTFGWTLTDSAWSVYANSNLILKATSAGLEVNGKIQATEGWIGGSSGFKIDSNKIYKNISVFGGTQSTGVYIGTDGIQLGQGFKVNSAGSLTATSGTFGTLSVDSQGRTGGSYRGSLSGCGGSISSGINVGSKSITTFVKDLVANTVTANYIKSILGTMDSLSANTVYAGTLVINGHRIARVTMVDGEGVTRRVLGWN